MGFLLDAVTPEKFENQRNVVKEEKYQNQISRQYGMSYEILGQNLYPPSHPYNWPVIGYVDDLERANIEDLKNFFLRWYGPNNAILTISGDVKSKDVLPLVSKYFGSIPREKMLKSLGLWFQDYLQIFIQDTQIMFIFLLLTLYSQQFLIIIKTKLL